MKKFITDNIAWLLIAFALVAIVALVFAIKNKKQLAATTATTAPAKMQEQGQDPANPNGKGNESQ